MTYVIRPLAENNVNLQPALRLQTLEDCLLQLEQAKALADSLEGRAALHFPWKAEDSFAVLDNSASVLKQSRNANSVHDAVSSVLDEAKEVENYTDALHFWAEAGDSFAP